MVQIAKNNIESFNFDNIKKTTDEFIVRANNFLEVLGDKYDEICLQTEPPIRRIGRKKIMSGEIAKDDRVQDQLQLFRVEVFRKIIDQISTSLQERFSENQPLINNC